VASSGELDHVMYLWTVYDSPEGYAGKFVGRQLGIIRGDGPRFTGQLVVASTLERLRRMLPPGLACIARSEDDEPTIVETWM
jgi:hypothetical protein